jgi:hypothetical protein
MKKPPGFRASFGAARGPGVEVLQQPTASSRSRRQRYNQCMRTCVSKGESFATCAEACGLRTVLRSSLGQRTRTFLVRF